MTPLDLIKSILLIGTCLLFINCGGGTTRDALDDLGVRTLKAGESITISRFQVVLVPAGTTIRSPNTGNTAIISGNKAEVEVSVGSIITVPTTSNGIADNVITGT
jgi:hypothetical protein